MVNDLYSACSFHSWYPIFKKNSLKATILHIPDDVLNYLEDDEFLLPREATKPLLEGSEWNDGSPVTPEEEEVDNQPTFPEFSKKIQDVLEEYKAVFIKTNWSSPSDATWVAPTRTLKCKTLEEIYLLLKTSNRISKDLRTIRSSKNCELSLSFCLVLKQWRDINPCTEFRCFVMDNKLIAMCQRDISQYHSFNESEKYNIRTDIKSLFLERIKGRFPLCNYSFDVVRREKDIVKIVDFGPMDESSTKGTLFTYEDLCCRVTSVNDTPEFRFIGEEIGIQPKSCTHFCIPEEISEFFQSGDNITLLDFVQKEVESQRKEHEKENADVSEST